MAVQWKNMVIAVFCIFGFMFTIYKFLAGSKDEGILVRQTTKDLEVKEKLIAQQYKRKLEKGYVAGKPCCRRDENNLLGKLSVNTKLPSSLTELEEKLPFVKLGGHWQPLSCTPAVKVAIIVPYRDRMNSLLVLLRHLHPMLNRQRIDYQLFVIEQSSNNSFNKGKLQNIGYTEALKYHLFDCFVFHDVDLIPEDDRNYYDCPSSPLHLSAVLDKFNYNMYSPEVFGGAAAFSRHDFKDVNGYSNSFYGVEGENDDMLARLRGAKKQLKRPILEISRYSMLKHKRRLEKKEKGHTEQRDRLSHEGEDGLKRLRYKVLHNEKFKLFTLIKVDLLWDKNEKEAF